VKAPAGLAHLLLGQPDLAEQLMRALALKGALPQYLEGEIGTSITALDLTTTEFQFLRRIVRLSQGFNAPAVAAQFSQCAFAPVANAPRTMCVVERVIIANFSATNLQYFVDSNFVNGAFPAPGVPKSGLDDRSLPFNTGQPVPAFGVLGLTAAGAILGLGAIRIAVPAGNTFSLDLDWVFTNRTVNNTPAPSVLAVQVSAVNAPLDVTFVWRERPLLSSEAL
jgi:hypothetical protein